MDSLFSSVLSDATLSVSLGEIIAIIVASLIVGLIISYLYTLKVKSSKSFVSTLCILPAIVAMVIIMVNGNIGTGVAVAGAFSLIRFRSLPGTAREIGAIFLAMAAGLTLGMGYIGFALLYTIILSVFYLLLDVYKYGDTSFNKRFLTIVIPEDLNYTNVFDEVFEEYTSSYLLNSVKSTNMGSMFKIKYELTLINSEDEKDFIDDLRTLNGNLDILVTRGEMNQNEL